MPASNHAFGKNLLVAIILYATVLIYQGYQYGQSDQSQILPVLYELDHQGTYALDHYVNHYLTSGINERTIFHALLRNAGYAHPWFLFAWHAIFGITLLLAWINIGSLFIKNKGLQWLCVGLILTVGFHTSTGSNELYYNQFIPSLAAKAFASWGLYYWLLRKYLSWTLLLIIAGYLQPLVGLQLFLLTSLAYGIESSRKHFFKKFPWPYIVIYLIATLPWLVMLVINNGSRNDPDAFMEIMEMRLSHHFFASYFGIGHLILGVFFFLATFIFYKEKLKWLLILIFSGCLIYEIGVELLKWPLILYTQWWKTTIWLEAFAFIAITAIIEKEINLQDWLKKFSIGIPITLLLLVAVYRLSGVAGSKPLYMQPLNKSKNDEVDISKQSEQLTHTNSVFIIPPDLSAFRWYSKRSSYVDYKAMIHQEAFLKDWYRRIEQVYDYNLSTKIAGENISDLAKRNFNNPSKSKIADWKSLGITHIISFASGMPTLQLLYKNETYALYKIP